MPNSDQLAKEGLRYTNFHTTFLCSPTRAALVTGRNHGLVGFEQIAELSTGFPGYNGIIGKENATIGRILQANGDATAWFGKDHNVPLNQMTEAGPKDQWPIGMGFDYFYGFFGGDMDQWHPTLFENVNQVFPDIGHPGYNLNIDLADKATAWLQRINSLKPDQPVFLYYAPGATHAPHQPTPEWIAKFKGKFDSGWDAYREEVFKRQKELGIIPQNAKLTPWPDESAGSTYPGIALKHWNQLTAYQKQAFAHEMEVYAAYLAETDYEIGRVIQAFKDTGRYDNTLIILIHGDNGASGEGTPEGTPSEVADFNTKFPTVEEYGPKYLAKWGSEYTDPHYPVAWAWALDTPFKWTKQVSSYFGGTKNGMVISWPGHIGDPSSIRTQFHHVIDIVPTILNACGIVEPDEVDGVKQNPIEGVSLAYTFDKTNAHAPSTHHSQYFEMFGAMGMYNDGWIASTDPFAIPWLLLSNKPQEDVWGKATWHLADSISRFSVNLIGGPAMAPKDFVKWKQKTILVVSIQVVAPTGQYYPSHLINPGSNRWAFKPEVGYSQRWRNWILDAYGAVWFFTENNDDLTGREFSKRRNTLTQAPIGAIEMHLSYDVKPRLWASVDGNYWYGGETTVDNVLKIGTLQSSSRIGGTVSVPITKHQSLKFSYSDGELARIGGTFQTVSFVWQYSWLGRPK